MPLAPGFFVTTRPASIVFHAPWHKITDTTVDASIETHMTGEMLTELGKSQSAAAQYIVKYAIRPKPGSAGEYLWDELAAAAWLDPSIIASGRNLYVDVSVDKGANYADMLTWSEDDKPAGKLPITYVQVDVDWPKFRRMFMDLMMAPTPGAKDPQMLDQQQQATPRSQN